MGFLKVAVAAAVALAPACYDPDLERDPDDAGASPDAPAGPVAPDATPPDAETTVLVRVIVEGRGRIVDEQFGIECEGSENDCGDCSYDVPVLAVVSLEAIEIHHHWDFDAWTSTSCAGQPATCTTTAAPPAIVVTARFADQHGGGGGDDDDDDEEDDDD